MKSLQESLFDSDLVSQNLPHEKLFKSRITKKDITELIAGINEDDFDNIKNRHLKSWAEDFYRKYYKNNPKIWWLGTFGLYDPKDSACKMAIDWLRFNNIHTDISWNDRMYASSLDVDFFNNTGSDSDGIFEWIMFSNYMNRSTSEAYLLVNRKEYDEIDQKIIHKMIEIIAKK